MKILVEEYQRRTIEKNKNYFFTRFCLLQPDAGEDNYAFIEKFLDKASRSEAHATLIGLQGETSGLFFGFDKDFGERTFKGATMHDVLLPLGYTDFVQQPDKNGTTIYKLTRR